MKHRLKEDNMHANLEMQAKSELLRLVDNQELAWKCAQDAVENVDRRLKLLEDGWVKLNELVERNAEASFTRLDECSTDKDVMNHYNHIYFSPLFEDRERESVKEIPSLHQNDSGSLDDKKYMELLDLEAEMGRQAPILSECWQRRQTEMLCDKSNSSLVLPSMATNHDKNLVPKFLGGLHLVQQTVCMHTSICQKQNYRPPPYKLGDLNVVIDKVDLQAFLEFHMNFLCQMAKYLDGFSQELLLYFADGDKYSWSKQLLAAIQELANLKISLKTAIRQLEMEEMKNKLVVENVRDEEKSHAEVVKEYALELEMKEKLLSSAQQLNIQLTNDMSESEATLTEWRTHFKGLIASLGSQLNEAHGDRAIHQKIADHLMQNLGKREERVMYLERVLDHKDKQIEEIRKRMEAIQNETDSTVMEKYDLIKLIQAIGKESSEQSYRISELVGVNEELSHFAEMKDDQVASMGKETARLQELFQETSGENSKLMQDLETTRKLVEALKERVGTLKSQYKYVQSGLCNAEFELLQRETTLERLAKHLAVNIQDYYCTVEDNQQIDPSSRMTNKKVQKKRQAQIILVEQNLASEQLESSIFRNKITEMMAKHTMMQKRKGERRFKVLCFP
eukprot:c22556_g1_i1 orf=392-2257(-)